MQCAGPEHHCLSAHAQLIHMNMYYGTRAPVGNPALRNNGHVALRAGTQLQQGRYTRCRHCRRRVLLPLVRAEPGRALEEAWAEAVDEAEDGEAGSAGLPSAGHGFDGGLVGLEELPGTGAGTDAGTSEAGSALLPAAATSGAQPEPLSRADVNDLISKVVNLVRTAHILAPYDKKDFNVALLLWCVPDARCLSGLVTMTQHTNSYINVAGGPSQASLRPNGLACCTRCSQRAPAICVLPFLPSPCKCVEFWLIGRA